jgi:uncharacterized protein (UPF0147 family)
VASDLTMPRNVRRIAERKRGIVDNSSIVAPR